MKLIHQGNRHLKVVYRRDLGFDLHLHNAIELVVTTKGQATAICDSGRYHLTPGDIFVAFPNQVHGYEHGQSGEGYVMIIPMNPYLSPYRSFLDQKIPVRPVLHQGEWPYEDIRHLMEMATRDYYSATAPVMQGYFLLIVGKLLPVLTLKDATTDHTNALQATLMFLNDHYTEPLTRQDISNTVGYNESYISHLFSNILHTTLTDYITALRIDDADQLLSNTELSISQIAVTLGFGSIRSFNRAFRKKRGISPSEYRSASKASSSQVPMFFSSP